MWNCGVETGTRTPYWSSEDTGIYFRPWRAGCRMEALRNGVAPTSHLDCHEGGRAPGRVPQQVRRERLLAGVAER